MELKLEHKELIAEEGINVKELPKEIISAIRGLDLMIGKYKKNPTEENQEKIEKKSVEIADEILTWNERDLEEEEEQQQEEIAETEEEKTAKEKEQATKPAAVAETEILEALKENGRIYSHDLKRILEADSINSIPDKLKIGNTILERSLAFYYKVD